EEIGAPDPDLLIILDIPAKEGLLRATGRKGKANLQFENLERLVKVREVYLEIARQDTCPSIIVDAMEPLDDVSLSVYNEITRVIETRSGADSISEK
ncbi:thymidylate kinase, partial [Candidatus Thorarchaeota archaeon]